MEMQELEITIDHEGKIQVKVNGAHGADCLALTKNIEDVVGVVEDRVYSPEYYEQPVTTSEHQRLAFR
ncbi:DUF2997 domain-containing protein [Methanoregula sp.]|uniref:DUF2997 domain-containing protein n=1 Tax=Methanoregula sp. TaxID=2052170 RepID=UPI00236D4CE3|nr:DUF2997 domain-containing protein [Methanoregula sp.]MDD1686629.1 DUF2997 domain-containing protein [Methanoregula sp.]